jgi:hypothetical protein
MAKEYKVTAHDISRLRKETNASMMECKIALINAEGDYEKAKKYVGAYISPYYNPIDKIECSMHLENIIKGRHPQTYSNLLLNIRRLCEVVPNDVMLGELIRSIVR